ncbi:MAG: NAD(P)-dependent oxidoreductase [Pseudomonadota bacterium]|nr:NAD(P)-dependent oxidoreductase [Pseudomonadota bacterium]
MAGSLAGKTIFITGGSRGIGRAIALRAAKDGAQVVIAAKTDQPNPKLPGTIHTTAAEIEQAGGKALAVACDIRFEDQVQKAVDAAVVAFGGIDVLVNNASAINLTPTLATPIKRFDLMMGINTRGTWLCSQTCLPHLKKAKNPHILTLSPPLDMKAKWFAPHLAYTISKFGMSMCVLGLAEELRADGIAVNALWPRTLIATDALNLIEGIDRNRCRRPEIVADAAHLILNHPSRSTTGHFFSDEEVLAAAGLTDFTAYAVDPANAERLYPDLFY